MKTTNQPIEIPTSKRKIVLLLFGCILFEILSYWIWIVADSQTHYAIIYLRFASIIGGIFFGLGLIFGIVKLFDRRAGLIISAEGIQNNLGITKGFFYSWMNITGFEIVKIRRTRLLLIFIDNAEEIINKKSKWKQKIMRSSQNIYGTPFSIGSGTLKCHFDELLKFLSDRLNAVKYAGIQKKYDESGNEIK